MFLDCYWCGLRFKNDDLEPECETLWKVNWMSCLNVEECELMITTSVAWSNPIVMLYNICASKVI